MGRETPVARLRPRDGSFRWRLRPTSLTVDFYARFVICGRWQRLWHCLGGVPLPCCRRARQVGFYGGAGPCYGSFALWPPEFLCRRSAVRQAGRSLRPAEARNCRRGHSAGFDPSNRMPPSAATENLRQMSTVGRASRSPRLRRLATGVACSAGYGPQFRQHTDSSSLCSSE